jgi:HSP20 family protein
MTNTRRDTFSEVWGEMNRFQDELNRFFGRFSKGSRVAAGTAPLLNVWEDEHSLYAEADLPDLNVEKLEVFVTEGNQLTVQGERKAPEVEGAVWHRQERPFGQFMRVLTLPSLVDADRVEATYANGVLKVSLPKSEAAKPRKITVKTA